MLFDLIRGGDTQELLTGLFLCVPVVVICLTFHEMAHGFIAYLLGDHTAKASGRLTFDPMVHIDPWGFLCMLLMGFGWARPVPVNISQLKNRRLGMGLIAAAGPIANIILGFVAYVIALLIELHFHPTSGFMQILVLFFSYIGAMSVGLAVFNLIPLHPLDGSRILDAILPLNLEIRYRNFMDRYGPIILLLVIVFLWFGGLSALIVSARYTVLRWAMSFVGVLF